MRSLLLALMGNHSLALGTPGADAGGGAGQTQLPAVAGRRDGGPRANAIDWDAVCSYQQHLHSLYVPFLSHPIGCSFFNSSCQSRLLGQRGFLIHRMMISQKVPLKGLNSMAVM